jgi:protein ImuA
MRMEPAREMRAGGVCASVPGRKSEIGPLIEALRRHIARIEEAHAQFGRPKARGQPWFTGVAELDSHLPAQGLLRTGLHDVAPAAYGDMPAAMGFALALALRRMADAGECRPLLWCRLASTVREYGRLYGHGLEQLGLSRRRFITVTLKKPVALLWTMEEALKSGALALVLGDADGPHADLTVTRRLQLAAHAGKSAGFLIFAREAASATASHTRWRVASAASRSPPYDRQSPGAPAWSVELTRARGGRPGAWIVEWQNAPHGFSVVPGFRGGAVHPWPDQAEPLPAAEGVSLRAG